MAKKFLRKDTHKKKRLPLNWRKPDGITNKKRLTRKGHSANAKAGFGTKANERGKNKQGLLIVTVSNLAELKKIDPKTQSALLTNVGKKKKLELIAEAEKSKIVLTNFNSKSYKERAEKFLLEKKQESTTKKEEKKQESKEEKPKTEQKEELSQEEKKKAEKVEKDKVLIKSK